MNKGNAILRSEADRMAWINKLNQLVLDERGWDVTCYRHRIKRSLGQNALFHVWTDIAANEFGNESLDKVAMKEEIKRICECPETSFIGLDGTEQKRRSTSHLDTIQMSAFMDRCYRYLTIEWRLQLPTTEFGYYAEAPPPEAPQN